MSVLICGVLTYDTIMVLNDKFKIHATDRTQPIDMYYSIPDLRRQFGGCAGNIAYNLKLLGGTPLPMATVGHDFSPYAEWLTNHGIPQDYITRVPHSFTAQTYVTVDMDDNRITAFHPGAMMFSGANQVFKAKNIKIGVIAQDTIDAMMSHALQFVEMGVPFLFDPGIAIKEFDGVELLKFAELAAWILVNEQEYDWMKKHTGLTAEQIARRVRALIVTQGAKGATIFAEGTKYQIPAARVQAANDSTGCGDAFCAGILYGLQKDIDWETTGRIANLVAAIKIEHHGTQNHSFSLESFKARFKKHFGFALIL